MKRLKPLLQVGCLYAFIENGGYILYNTVDDLLGMKNEGVRANKYHYMPFLVLSIKHHPGNEKWCLRQSIVEIFIDNKRFYFRMNNYSLGGACIEKTNV